MLATLKQKPNIIAITEVMPKGKSGEVGACELNLDGYVVFSNELGLDGQRGVIIYVDSRLLAHTLDMPVEFAEHVFISLQLDGSDQLVLGAIYRSPSSDKFNDEKISAAINYVSSKNPHKLLVIGDFNLPGIDWKNKRTEGSNQSMEYKLLDIIRINSLEQHVNQPTRQRGRDVPHILDLVLTPDTLQTDIQYLSPLGMSDHSVLLCNLMLKNESKRSFESKFIYSKGNYDRLRNYVSHDWEQVLKQDYNVDTMWNVIKNTIAKGMRECIPTTDPNKIYYDKHLHPYSQDFGQETRKKHRLWTRYMETKDAGTLSKYKIQRNKVKSLSRKVHAMEQENVARLCKTNPKKFWKYVRKSTRARSGVGDLKIVKDDGSKITLQEDQQKADALVNFYSSVFTRETDNGPELEHKPHIEVDMSELVITESDVLSKLNDLKTDKSPGDDGLHPKVLHELRAEIAKPLQIIFQESLNTGCVPNDWKSGIITAIYKKGSKSEVGNYRPVSLTSVVSKIFESIIRDHIMRHFITNKLLSNKQYGFIKGRSTLLQLLHMLDKWTSLLEEGGQIDAIYTDFEKAFDKVPHRRLITKLKAYGISSTLVSWIKVFLDGRKQRVRLNGKYSKWEDVLSGIPQGSVLGPLLFIIYINDLPEVCNQMAEMYLFADDAKMYKYISDPVDQQQLQNTLLQMQQWSDKWLLRLNVNKCKITSFGRDIAYRYEYYLTTGQSSTELTREGHLNDLGIEIDDKLNFSLHIHIKVNKAYQVLGVVRRNFYNLAGAAFVMIYKAMVRSIVEYNSAVWSPYKVADVLEIEKVQKRATKIVRACKHMCYEDRLRYLDLPTLKFRRLRGDMIQTYKIVTGKCDESVAPALLLNKQSITRGHEYKLATHRTRYDLRKHFFTNRIVNVWNGLTDKVVNAQSVDAFKRELDNFWANQECRFNFTAKLTGTGGACLEI